MILFLLAYFGGVLTIVSPCILPVLPFVFARADRPFLKNGLPLLVGMAVTFALIATLAAFGGGWAVRANEFGRDAAIVLLAIFGVVLLFPSLADWLTRPLVALGARLSASAEQGSAGGSVSTSLVLGIATGLLWAPCAGPILGLILTGAALQGANLRTTLLLAAYAAGAATSLALALLVGGRIFAAMKRSLGVGEWIRRGLGVAVLAAVVVIALGLDTGFLTQVSVASTASLEQGLLDRVHPQPPKQQSSMSLVSKGDQEKTMMKSTKPAAAPNLALPVLGPFPSLAGAVAWLNSPPLNRAALKGKVVVIDFWTYSCINCLRAIPYVRAWWQKYKDEGLVVIGVHSPEFAFEHDIDNVKKAVADLKITYPVAIDNNFAIWRAFENEYWPAHYFIDAQGRIRHEHFGEGDYRESERVIQQLLAEAGNKVTGGMVTVHAAGAEAPPDTGEDKSPETYIGYFRADNFASPGGEIHDAPHDYIAPQPALNEWGLTGDWTVGMQHATLNEKDGSIVYRFHARDLHLVLGPAKDGKPVRFRVTLDGAPPGASHGSDIDAAGNGLVTGQRLYQLIRQPGPIKDRTFEIQFLDPGVDAYAFTFG
jgi:cytochrome c biogenesis protein CcdA/thiol-disulfide isomerase/thioredoxin